jgi:hypothetical protein
MGNNERVLALLILEALETGDLAYLEALAVSALEDGPDDNESGRRVRCDKCGIERWPGELEHHLHESRRAA